MAEAKRDKNQVPTLLAVSLSDGISPVVLWADPSTHALLVTDPNAMTITSGQYKVFVTVGTANADYITDGVNDEIQIAQAIAAVGAVGGGIVYLLPGTFNVSAHILWTYSNVTVMGAGIGVTTVLDLYDGSGENSNFGIFSIRSPDGTIAVGNAVLMNLSINLNSFATIGAYWCAPQSASTNVAKNMTFDHVEFYGRGPDATGSTGCIRVTGKYGTSNKGSCRGLFIYDCIFRDGVSTTITNQTGTSIFITSDDLSEVRICNNRFYNVFGSTISIGSGTGAIPRTRRDWLLEGNNFYNTVGTAASNYFGTAVCDFVDGSRTGFDGIKIINNHFEALVGSWTLDGSNNTQQYYNIAFYSSDGSIVSGNTFKNVCNVMAPGYDSHDASYYSDAQNTRGYTFSNNVVFNALRLLDSDGHIGGTYTGNVFWGVKNGTLLGGYAIHYPCTYDGNIFVNCGTAGLTGTGNDVDLALFGIEDGGAVIQNNVIYNDPIFSTPAAPSVATGAAGVLTGTYLYKVTFISATGNESTGGTTSASVSPSSQKVSLTNLPIGPTGTEGRMIYRTAAGGADGTQKFVERVNGNVTTVYTDNIADAALGQAVPTTNATASNLKYIFGELYGGIHADYENVYRNNHIIGSGPSTSTFFLVNNFKHKIIGNTGVKESTIDVTTINVGDVVSENYTTAGQRVQAAFAQGNVTGATTFNRINGEIITATLTGNITVTLTAPGFIGQQLVLILSQSAGGNTVTWPATFKKAGGALALSAGAAAVDLISMVWDGTNWNEKSRALNLS